MTTEESDIALYQWAIDNAPRQHLITELTMESFAGLRRRSGHLFWEVNHAWAVSASISFSIGKPVTVSWSVTERDTAHALAAIALYRTVVEFAAQLECVRLSLGGKVGS